MILFKCIKHRVAYDRAHQGAVRWKSAKKGLTCDMEGCPRKADAQGDDGYARDEGCRARMSAASKKALADPEVRARMSAARKKALADKPPEARADWASKVGRKPKKRMAA